MKKINILLWYWSGVTLATRKTTVLFIVWITLLWLYAKIFYFSVEQQFSPMEVVKILLVFFIIAESIVFLLGIFVTVKSGAISLQNHLQKKIKIYETRITYLNEISKSSINEIYEKKIEEERISLMEQTRICLKKHYKRMDELHKFLCSQST